MTKTREQILAEIEALKRLVERHGDDLTRVSVAAQINALTWAIA